MTKIDNKTSNKTYHVVGIGAIGPVRPVVVATLL